MKITDTKAAGSAKKNKKSSRAGESERAKFASMVESAMDKPEGETISKNQYQQQYTQKNIQSAIPERAEDRGSYMLDKLESLEQDILTGNPTTVISNLKEALATKAINMNDLSPKMRELLDEIDLRASIEIAKLED